VRDEQGQPLHRAVDVIDRTRLDIEFADGHRTATAGARDSAPTAPATKAMRAPKKTSQGSLF